MLENPVFAMLAVAVLAVLLKSQLDKITLRKKKESYRDMPAPVLMLQEFGETETEFWARVRRNTARFQDAGNKWMPPVVAIPRDAVFTVTVLGDSRTCSTVGMREPALVQYAATVYLQVYEIWGKKTLDKYGIDLTMTTLNFQSKIELPTW